MDKLTEQDYLKAYSEFADAIFRHCYFRVSDETLAEDMVQNVFMKAWEYIERGNKVGNLRALLYKIANDLIVDHYRKKKTLSLDNLQEGGFDPASHHNKESLENVIAGKDMLELLSQLDEKYRKPVVMRFIDDLSPKEIAELLGESENSVSVWINRGLKKIRELLKEGEV